MQSIPRPAFVRRLRRTQVLKWRLWNAIHKKLQHEEILDILIFCSSFEISYISKSDVLYNQTMDLKFFDNSEALFKEYLKTGINIFTGAGFSVLPSPSKETLPSGDELIKDLREKFPFPSQASFDLGELCQLLYQKYGEFTIKSYLLAKFLVNDFNPLYSNLLKATICSYTTTNVDNLFSLAVKRDGHFFLRDLTSVGQSVPRTGQITFLPLHGSVEKGASNLLFSKSEIAVNGENNQLYFAAFRKIVASNPVLAIGYSFRDADVFSALSSSVKDYSRFWILLLPGDDKNFEYFSSLGYHVILGDTEALLRYFGRVLPSLPKRDDAQTLALAKYRIPQAKDVVAFSKDEFFVSAKTGWYPILTGAPILTENFYKAVKFVQAKEKAIFIGTKCSGKTVLAMQIAYHFREHAIFCSSLTSPDEAAYLVSKLSQNDVIIVDDCALDAVAFDYLLTHFSGSVLGFSENYAFEGAKHLFISCPDNDHVVDISDLASKDLDSLWNSIPTAVRYSTRKDFPDGSSVSFLEALKNFVPHFISRGKIASIIQTISEKRDFDSLSLLCLSVYLCANNSIVSADSILSLFGTKSYDEALKSVHKLQTYLIEAGEDQLVSLEKNQDYFVLRSKLFCDNCFSILRDSYRDFFASVVKAFLLNSNPYCICFVDRFSRKAFDSAFFAELFGRSAEPLYDAALQKFDSLNRKYILQQYALYCCLELQNNEKAFLLIDEARLLGSKSYSIENSYAVIQFKSNLGKKDKDAIATLKDSMERLMECYKDDIRKDMHAKYLGEFACSFYQEYGDNSYLLPAYRALVGAIQSDSNKHKRLEESLTRVLHFGQESGLSLPS